MRRAMSNFPFLRDIGCRVWEERGEKGPVKKEFEKQRLELGVRKALVYRVRANGADGIDPVLRSHLGLDGFKLGGTK